MVRRPCSRIEERTSCRRTLLVSCCQPPPALDSLRPGSAVASDDDANSEGRSEPEAPAAAARARACGIDFDCTHADRVAILPAVGGVTLDQMFQQSAGEIIARVHAARARMLRDRVPPCVVPRRFGWTDSDKYEQAEIDLRLSRVAELSDRDQVCPAATPRAVRIQRWTAELVWLFSNERLQPGHKHVLGAVLGARGSHTVPVQVLSSVCADCATPRTPLWYPYG